MTDIRTIAIVGASLAGASAAQQLRADGFDGAIVMFGEEPEAPYLRPPLTKEYLRGESDREATRFRPEAWYADHAIDLRLGARVSAIEPRERRVVLDDGTSVAFDRALLATGAASRRLDIPGADLDGLYYLRSLSDADALRAAAAVARRAVVVGGGWIGSEAAASLRQLGLDVAMVVDGSGPLERVLGPEVSGVYRDLHARHGVEILARRRAVAFRGRAAVSAVELSDGTLVEGDLVVAGIGARPRTELATAAGVAVDGGIVADERLETSAPGVFVAGDVAAPWHPVFGTRLRVEHWDNARRQGRAAARGMLGRGEPYAAIPYFYSDQFELGMEYAGHAPAWDRVVLRGDPRSGSFIAFWVKDGRVVAGMNANTPDVNGAISGLVASQRRVRIERLADPDVPIGELAETGAAGAETGSVAAAAG